MAKPKDPIALQFDHFGADIADDPYPTYRYLRENCPVGWSESYGGFWILTRYDDINEVFHKPDLFSSYPVAIPSALGQPGRLIPNEVDPPEHTAYRRILDPFFGPKIMRTLEPEARRLAVSLIEDMVKAPEECDFIASFATAYPTMLFCKLVGWPESKRPQLVTQVDRILTLGTLLTEDPEKHQAAVTDIGATIMPFLHELVQESREDPKDDLVGLLTTSQKADGPLNDLEILGILFSILAGGLETVKSVLGNAISHLGVHHHLRDQIVADPAIIPTAVEEMMRFESPINSGRTVASDVEFHGQSLRAGERVLVVTGSAGRDGSTFNDPDEVDFVRSPINHLTFAAGRHRCLGSHLARMELRVAFEEIHRRMPSYTIPAGATIERHVGFSRGVDRLPFTTGQLVSV